MQQALTVEGTQGTLGGEPRWRLPTKEEVAKGASKGCPRWRGERAVFFVFDEIGRQWAHGREWICGGPGWSMRVEPLERGGRAGHFIDGCGFPAWAGMTEGDARATCEAMDRLLVEGV
jgi:hypothetical protein